MCFILNRFEQRGIGSYRERREVRGLKGSYLDCEKLKHQDEQPKMCLVSCLQPGLH